MELVRLSSSIVNNTETVNVTSVIYEHGELSELTVKFYDVAERHYTCHVEVSSRVSVNCNYEVRGFHVYQKQIDVQLKVCAAENNGRKNLA